MITLSAYAKQSLNIFSSALNERIQPAVVFNDKSTLNQILADYIKKYPVRSITVVNADHQIMTSLTESPQSASQVEHLFDRLFFSEPIQLPIQHEEKLYGSTIVYGSSMNLVKFFLTTLIGLTCGVILILITLLFSIRINYRFILKEISLILNVAETINSNKAYYLRLPSSKIKEFQSLSNIFNLLLSKIQISTTQLEEENTQLSHQAKHDQLTQLPNRHYFHQVLRQYFNASSKANAALLFIDNNNFKDINDQYGHQAGDAVLQEMAVRLKDTIRHNDFIARLGGDEFAIILSNIDNQEQIVRVCDHLLKSSEKPIIFNHEEIRFSFSIGISFTQHSTSSEQLITQADNAMYIAKTLKEGWYISSPSAHKE
ncbi:diguanylate cyclase domain-containing protein [Acinetobacter sp. MD2(2019)]|uniref:sensor domain-containing diguanylate cyclase n=1 Tax=Acinetobacter sp. MD2(2019) TaxID=2605273 RepID=UPI002D77EAE8|nr:diguanylate cyclase [Acinetobacter sp. MD2(2019)]